jgi:hypothetical protein
VRARTGPAAPGVSALGPRVDPLATAARRERECRMPELENVTYVTH